MIHIETPEEFERLVQNTENNGKPFIVDCYTSWCKPCKRIAPHYEVFVNEFDAVFAKMDMDDEDLMDVAQAEGLSKMPYFMIYKNGTQVGALQHSDKTLVKNFFKDHVVYTGQETEAETEDVVSNGAVSMNEVTKFMSEKFQELVSQTNIVFTQHFTAQEVLQLIQENINKSAVTTKPAAQEQTEKIVEITSPEQFEELINNTTTDKALIVDCYAPWCKPCTRAAPHFKEFSTEFDATFAKLNIDDEDLEDIARDKGLTKIPFFMIFQNGVQVEEKLQNSQKDIIRPFLLRYVPLKSTEGAVKEVENITAPVNDTLNDDDFNFDMDF